jgi:hypothetical protein
MNVGAASNRAQREFHGFDYRERLASAVHHYRQLPRLRFALVYGRPARRRLDASEDRVASSSASARLLTRSDRVWDGLPR